MSTQFYEIYRMNGTIYGTPISGKTTYQLRKDFVGCFDLPGPNHRFFLVTSDDTIVRGDALIFATAVASGKVVRHHIDLSQIGRIRKNAS